MQNKVASGFAVTYWQLQLFFSGHLSMTFHILSHAGEHMTYWDSETCKAHPYAERMADLVRNNVPKGGKVLMLGLGGGAIGARLCSEYDVTVIEKSKDY